MMKKFQKEFIKIQQSQSKSKLRRYRAGFILMLGFFLGICISGYAADSEMYAGALPIPGTNNTSDYLTLSQSGTLLENDNVRLKWESNGNLVLSYSDEEVLWASNTENKGAILAFTESDGKLTIKSSSGQVLWSFPDQSVAKIMIQSDRTLLMVNGSGQKVWESPTSFSSYLNADGAFHTIPHVGSNTQEFLIPDTDYKYLYIRAEGADGGKKQVEEIWGDVRFKVAGGAGATIAAFFEIGTGSDMITTGSALRFIVGGRGQTRIGQTVSGCDGGGGTGVVFRKRYTSEWLPLVVAGGGGGAVSNCCGGKRKGGAGQTGENGGDGGGSGALCGGKNGDDGCVGDYQFTGYPGMGYNNLIRLHGSLPTGTSINHDSKSSGWKTWGFGGGGGGFNGGGGGGGYSGGGGSKPGYAGGGGGSYVDSDMAKAEFRKGNGTTLDTEDGFIVYQFRKTLFDPIRLAKDQTKCIDLANGNTAKGTNIQLVQCKDNPAQQWIIDGATIHLAEDFDKCLDVDKSGTANGTNIQLWDCNGTDAQHWMYDVATQSIRSALDFHTSLDLTQGNTTGGTNIQLYEFNNTGSQKWILDGVPSAMPTDANQRIHVVAAPNKCLDVANYNIANGANIHLTECKDHPAQYFTFDGRAIKLQAHPDKCLALDQLNTTKGTNIQLWDCKGHGDEHWIYDGFTKAFRSAIDPRMCLDVTESNFTNNANIQLWDCNETHAQQFEIY